MIRRIGQALSLFAAALVVGGCASTPSTDGASFSSTPLDPTISYRVVVSNPHDCAVSVRVPVTNRSGTMYIGGVGARQTAEFTLVAWRASERPESQRQSWHVVRPPATITGASCPGRRPGPAMMVTRLDI
jgi:hypothetical protein